MPRMARVVLKEYPHHVVQRGRNRQLVFAEAEDYAYCLMSNHVHLLLSPSDSKAGLSQLMKTLATRATRYRNKLEGRTGVLWESRYKSSVVESDRYLLACSRYIELNPVRARMVADVADYPWTSFAAHASQNEQYDWVDLDPCFRSLGATREEQSKRYVDFVRQSIPVREWKLIKNAVQRGQLTGSVKFIEEVEKTCGFRIEMRGLRLE